MDMTALVGAAYDAMISAKRSGGDRTVVSGRLLAEREMTEPGKERMEHIGTDPDYR